MAKRLFALCVFILLFSGLQAQPYGNEWIIFSQKYYKIKVAQSGIFRLDSSALASAGIPVGPAGIDPRNFQLFNLGQEQPVYINGEADGVFNTGDFIEFYGEKNTGVHDSAVYYNSPQVPNPYYSLFNDTAVYFLTWNSSVSNSRMQLDTSTAFASLPAFSHFIKDEVMEFHSDYYNGETDAVGGTDARYTRAEGWFGSVFGLGGSVSYNVNTSNRYLAAAPARIITMVLGASKDVAVLGIGPDHYLNIKYNGQLFKDTAFRGYEANRFIRYLPADSLGSSATNFTFTSLPGPLVTSNRTVVSYINIRYPHTFNLEGQSKFTMYIPDTLGPLAHVQMSNFSASGQAWLYDLSNARRILVTQTGSDYHALIPNTGAEKKCFISSEGNFISLSLQAINPSAQFTDFGSLSADSAFVIVTHASLNSSAANYQSYRSSLPYGGGHDVILAEIDELYDQFAYGVVKSPLSVKRFSDFLLDNMPSAPQNLFLLGKAIHMRDCRQNNFNYALDLVPSFGNPSSDNLFTAGLNGTIIAPAIPTGRLAAKNLNDVDLYLQKMQDYENRTLNPPAEWMKQILHFGGGSNSGEQLQFKGYLNYYKSIIEDTLYGGKVKDFFKTSSAPIEINTSDTLADLINNGVSLMTFFGHASGTGFDQSIDDISSYNPAPGHYPFLLANSCYAGDFHSTGTSSSEEFILIADKGMIGYLGSVGLGVPYALNMYSSEFYKELSQIAYNKSVGTQIKQTIAAIQSFALGDPLVASTCFEMSLHGDPALKINTHEAPDYKITNSDVYFDQESSIDSLTVFAVRTNIGKAIHDSIFTEVLRILPNGDSLVYLSKGLAPKFKDTIAVKIPVDFVNGIGLNKIKVTLDRNLEVAELDEGNNSTTLVDLLISGGTIAPVYPYEFAIVPNNTVTLKASTADPMAAARNYIFQIDTNDTFTSPLAFTIINSVGGVVSWTPPLTLSDTTVYYWRVSPDSTTPTNSYSWRESSFQYVAGKRGWEQAHFFQFKNDDYQYVKFNRPARKFDFVNDVKSIYAKNGIYPYIPYYDIIYKVNGDTRYLFSWLYPSPGFTFAVFDPISGENWKNYALPGGGGMYGSFTGYAAPASENAFEYFDTQDTAISNFINLIPTGHYVLMYTENYQRFGTYSPLITNALESLGASDVNTLADSVPYILWGQKGMAPGTGTEVVGGNYDSIIDLTATLTTSWTDGYIASPVIGPATSWDSLSWRYHSTDGPVSYDSIAIQLIGIAADGTEITLASFDQNTLNIPNLGSVVSATSYPRIRLVAHMKDDSLNTPPQLDRWQVIYTPVPEAAINPPVGYTIVNDTVQEGDQLRIQLPIQNISEYTFSDSLVITYWIEDADRVTHALPDKLKKNLFAAGEIILDTISVSTLSYAGDNALWVEVNPVGHAREQLEQYHFNNIIRIPFHTTTDKINPLLDVTFDGVHILNNDIVSAKPNILIGLKDENQFLALNDTSDFKVFLQSPGGSGSVARRIWFGPEMSFTPAVLPGNSCRINFTPQLPMDGTYQLIVQAKDKSDNQSGAIDYKISFEVVNHATITEVMNYPNPFSTSTRFVFTLTGSEVPQNFKIQIMTITGKVVREIFQDELGPLHVGRNITEYAWDGKDEFGDQLANGVYLYRVQTKLNGQNIEKRETEADQYFKKGWGKMYLMR